MLLRRRKTRDKKRPIYRFTQTTHYFTGWRYFQNSVFPFMLEMMSRSCLWQQVNSTSFLRLALNVNGFSSFWTCLVSPVPALQRASQQVLQSDTCRLTTLLCVQQLCWHQTAIWKLQIEVPTPGSAPPDVHQCFLSVTVCLLVFNRTESRADLCVSCLQTSSATTPVPTVPRPPRGVCQILF